MHGLLNNVHYQTYSQAILQWERAPGLESRSLTNSLSICHQLTDPSSMPCNSESSNATDCNQSGPLDSSHVRLISRLSVPALNISHPTQCALKWLACLHPMSPNCWRQFFNSLGVTVPRVSVLVRNVAHRELLELASVTLTVPSTLTGNDSSVEVTKV